MSLTSQYIQYSQCKKCGIFIPYVAFSILTLLLVSNIIEQYISWIAKATSWFLVDIFLVQQKNVFNSSDYKYNKFTEKVARVLFPSPNTYLRTGGVI